MAHSGTIKSSMCGLAGFLGQNGGDLEPLACRMSDTLRHRGPDASGVWTDASVGVALAHRRLAIIDRSESGSQPMWSEDGRWVVVFNGEVYNFPELLAELEACGCSFRGHSDTEVMLAAFQTWGVEPSLRRFNGMFAFALWNVPTQTLYLGRDRLGKKPLYYGLAGDTLLFGSELKALRAHPAFRPEIDSFALALYLKHLYVPAPRSIFRGIFKLPPGTYLKIPAHSVTAHAEPVAYWSARQAAERGVQNRFTSATEGEEQLEVLLRDAVKRRMVADVPLGAFLSGGIDSSLVVALMQSQSDIPVRTFTIGFHQQSYNEATHAKSVAHYLGTDHTELYVTPDEAMEVIPRLPLIYDEPFADSSQIPTFLVSQLARRHVTVSLSGDGGDELFGGYDSYRTNAQFKAKHQAWPRIARDLTSWAIQQLPSASWDSLLSSARRDGSQSRRIGSIGERLHRRAHALSQTSDAALHLALTSCWFEPENLLVSGTSIDASNVETSPRGSSFVETMMYLDTVGYLPDDILVKIDRASMAASLEVRCPLLDYRVAELAWRMPLSQKLQDGVGKAPLRNILHRYVPRELVDRPKVGFGVPIGDWLCGPLKPWASELLRPERLKSEGIFNPEPIARIWNQHLRGEADWRSQLWAVLMFQAWFEQSGVREPTTCQAS